MQNRTVIIEAHCALAEAVRVHSCRGVMLRMERRAARTAVSALLLAATVTLSSCSASGNDSYSDVESASTGPANSVPVDAGTTGRQAVAAVDGVEVRGATDDIDRDKHLTISEGHTTIPEAEARVASTEVVSIRMDDGNAQPSAPVMVEFDLSDRPDLVSRITDGVVPVIETASESDPSELDMVLTEWNPDTETVTADLPHLTNVWVSLFDMNVVEADVRKVFEAVRGTSNSTCRERSELTLDGIEYTLTALSPGAIAACLVNSGGALAVDLENATGMFYTISVTPDAAGGTWTNSGPLSMSAAAGSLISQVVLGSKGVLTGRSEGRLVMNEGIDQFDIRLMPQQQGILAQSLLSGLSMLGLDLKRLESIPEAWDCITTAFAATAIDSNFSPNNLYEMITDAGQCAVTVTAVRGGDKVELHRLGSAIELFSLTQQLTDFIAGGLQEFAGDSVKKFQVRSSRPTTTATPAPAATTPVQAGVDRIELKTWAYDRIEGNTYVADNTGKKKVNVHVNSFAGDEDIRRGCQTTITVTGPGLSLSKVVDSCYVGNPGMGFTAPFPGEYLVTATVAQQGHADITSQVVVNLLPNGTR